MPGQTFEIMEFDSDDDLDLYSKDAIDPFLTGQICLGLYVQDWDIVNDNKRKFNVGIRYSNVFYRGIMSNNLTNAEDTNAFDFDYYYQYMNTSLIEVMSSITEEAIDKVNEKQDPSKKGTYQLQLSPTYQPP